MHFYAEENRYGRGTTTTIRRNGREIIVSAGSLYRFPSRKERDDWLEGGNHHRAALTSTEARRLHATGSLVEALWEDDNTMKSYGPEAGFERFIEPGGRW